MILKREEEKKKKEKRANIKKFLFFSLHLNERLFPAAISQVLIPSSRSL